MIRYYLFAIIILFSSAIQASTLDHTSVMFTNNTSEPVVVQSQINATDKHFQKGKAWDGKLSTIAPYETKEILWFSRIKWVKPNQVYQFNLSIHKNDPVQPITITFIEKGKRVLGSELTGTISFPNQMPRPMFQQHFEEITNNFWEHTYRWYERLFHKLDQLNSQIHVVLDEPMQQVTSTSSQALSVLTYNTQLMPAYANVIDKLNHPSLRYAAIAKKIQQFDVVILEELYDKALRENMTRALRPIYPYYTNVVGAHNHKLLTGGVMIFSKWRIIKEDQRVYQAGVDIDSLAAKGAVYARIDKAGNIYHIFGTHVQSGDKPKHIAARVAQIQELAQFIDSQRIPATQPVLIGGDFNTDGYSDQIEPLLKLLNVSLPEHQGYRYSSDGVINTMSINKDRGLIDFVFSGNDYLTPTVQINRVFILRELANEKMWPNFDLSDHFPVAAYFSFGQQTT